MQKNIVILKKGCPRMFFFKKGKETLKAIELINESLTKRLKGKSIWIPKSVIKPTREVGRYTILQLRSWFIEKMEKNCDSREKERIQILFGV